MSFVLVKKKCFNKGNSKYNGLIKVEIYFFLMLVDGLGLVG